jgi:hypothetical protein
LTAGERREHEVSEKLADDLDRFLLNYRTKDGKVITEGEVMTAWCRIIVRKCANDQRVQDWLANISVGTMSLRASVKETK